MKWRFEGGCHAPLFGFHCGCGLLVCTRDWTGALAAGPRAAATLKCPNFRTAVFSLQFPQCNLHSYCSFKATLIVLTLSAIPATSISALVFVSPRTIVSSGFHTCER